MSKVLTVAAVDRLKPGEIRREIADAGVQGLYLVLQPSGAKSWAVRYRVGQRTRKLTLGPYPRVTLVRARERARATFEAIDEGRDPAAEKRATAHRGEDADSFPVLARTFIERHAQVHNRSWRETARLLGLKPDPKAPKEFRIIRGGLCERWANRSLGELRRRHVIEMLDALVDRDISTSANRTLAALRKLCNWAVARDMIPLSPCAGVKPPAKEVSRDRVLTADEIRAVWLAADALGHPFGYVVQLLLLTGQRRAEVAGMRLDEIDMDKRLWSIPRERTKNGLPHEVPLSGAAIAILRKVPRLAGTHLVFTGTGRTPVSGFSRAKRAIDAALGDVGPWRLHDLRRTVASTMGEIGIAPHIIEAVLNLISGAKAGIAGVYNRAQHLPERRAALERWAGEIERIVSGQAATVVPFPGRAL